jgi:hypothetical protein
LRDTVIGPADHQTHSTVDGDFTSQGVVGVYLDKDHGTGSFYHNVAFEGDFIFGSPSPIFTLVDPANAFPAGDLCEPYNVEANGNKVLFTGGADQLLKYPDDLYISSVQIKKNSTRQGRLSTTRSSKSTTTPTCVTPRIPSG